MSLTIENNILMKNGKPFLPMIHAGLHLQILKIMIGLLFRLS